MPSLLCPWLDQSIKPSQVVSRFPSVGALQKETSGSFSIEDEDTDTNEPMNVDVREEVSQVSDVGLKQSVFDPSHDHSYSFKHALTDGKTV